MKTASKILRIVALVLVGLTAAWTLISGFGTSCVAFGAENYESMTAIVPYKPLYQAFVFMTLAVGAAAVVDTVGLARRTRWAYVATIVTLVAGIAVGSVHMAYSTMLRGSSAPANLRVYLSILTLIVVLILRIPGIWNEITASGSSGDAGTRAAPGAAALIITGLGVLLTPVWVGATHVFDGRNWVEVLDTPLSVAGAALIVAGAANLARAWIARRASAAQAEWELSSAPRL